MNPQRPFRHPRMILIDMKGRKKSNEEHWQTANFPEYLPDVYSTVCMLIQALSAVERYTYKWVPLY